MPPRVAIMGAGIAGLACAHELKRHGIQPTVFEIRHRVGERFPNMEGLGGMLLRPHNDAFAYFERLGFPLRPGTPINRLVVHGPSSRAAFAGNLGFFTPRGHWPWSWERQMAAQTGAEILFNRNEDWRNLAADFDRVVVATGEAVIPESLGLWRRTVNLHIKGAVLRGRFDPALVEFWFNTHYAKTGYGYLAPFDHRYAGAAVFIPDATPEELDRYFEVFCRGAELGGEIVLPFKVEGYPVGMTSRLRHDKLLFVGNAGGFIEPAFYFGQFHSLASGVLAGRAIARDQNYEDLVVPHVARIKRFLPIRRFLDTLDDEDFDRFVRLTNRAAVKTLMFGCNLDWLGLFGRVLSLLGRYSRDFESAGRK